MVPDGPRSMMVAISPSSACCQLGGAELKVRRNESLINMATPALRVVPCDQNALIPSFASSLVATWALPLVECVSDSVIKSWVRRRALTRDHLRCCLCEDVWKRPWAFHVVPRISPQYGKVSVLLVGVVGVGLSNMVESSVGWYRSLSSTRGGSAVDCRCIAK